MVNVCIMEHHHVIHGTQKLTYFNGESVQFPAFFSTHQRLEGDAVDIRGGICLAKTGVWPGDVDVR